METIKKTVSFESVMDRNKSPHNLSENEGFLNNLPTLRHDITLSEEGFIDIIPVVSENGHQILRYKDMVRRYYLLRSYFSLMGKYTLCQVGWTPDKSFDFTKNNENLGVFTDFPDVSIGTSIVLIPDTSELFRYFKLSDNFWVKIKEFYSFCENYLENEDECNETTPIPYVNIPICLVADENDLGAMLHYDKTEKNGEIVDFKEAIEGTYGGNDVSGVSVGSKILNFRSRNNKGFQLIDDGDDSVYIKESIHKTETEDSVIFDYEIDTIKYVETWTKDYNGVYRFESNLANYTTNIENIYKNPVFIRDESMIGVHDMKENIDAEIDRGRSAAFERHTILGEVNTMQDLENYRNNYFGL